MTIETECLIVNLRIGLWEGRRLDKDASKEVTTRNGAESDAARVNKLIVPKDSLAAINKAAGALRLHFYDRTVPWKDNGDRLVTRKMFLKFVEEHEALMNAFNAEREKFVTETYPAARDQAQFRMGGLFDPNDYPPASELRHRFYAVMEHDVVTTSGDFRVTMDQKHVDSIKAAMDEAANARVSKAVLHVYERVIDMVGSYQSTMADPKKRFWNGLSEKLEEFIDLLPGLNFVDDPNLNAVHKELKAKLSGRNDDDLRKKPEERAAAAKEAAEVLDTMKGFMNAFKKAA